jgi:acyl-CoA synthetase (AMP-forming)/AMP-acid ligase II
MPSNLYQVLRSTAERLPEQDAIVQGDQRMTFSGWYASAADHARRFAHLGVQRGDRVILWLAPSPEMATALFGVWGTGGIPVLLDPNSKAPQLNAASTTVEPRVILFDKASPLPAEPDGPLIIGTDDLPDPPSDSHPESASQDEAASIVFTSGSTGQPKGVVQTHGNLVRGALTVAGYQGINERDRIICPVPWSFDYGYIQLQMSAATGATHVLPVAPHPQSVCDAITHHAPTLFAGLPSLFGYLLQGISPLRDTDISSIRTLTNTGGTIAAPVLEDLLELFPGRKLFLNYGLTESYRTTCLDPALVRSKADSIGKPIPGVDVIIVREDGSLADVEESGEIVHRGDFIFREYWNDPEGTSIALRPDPAHHTADAIPPSVLFTGDYGHKDAEGFIYFEGRRDGLLKVMGVRVSPIEIQDLLYASGIVREVAVFGMPHALLGDEVWAAVVPAPGVEDARLALVAYSRQVMTQNMSPRRILLKERLPLTTSGKVDYQALKREAASR